MSASHPGIVDCSGWWVKTPTRVGMFARVYINNIPQRTTSDRSVIPRMLRAITRRWISLVPS